MRGYVENASGLEDRIAFFLDDWLLPGYGWIFPLPGGRANVGVGTLVQSKPANLEPLRDLYERFIADPLSPASMYLRNIRPIASPRSWPLDLGPRRRRLAAPGLLVAGEAAGLVGPLTGAGIAFALATGGKAGEALAKSMSAIADSERPLHDYARGINRRMLPWLRSEALAQRWLSEPAHIRRLLSVADRVPGAGPVGARLLLHLG
jgi:flavin-dependent dehydrogenase